MTRITVRVQPGARRAGLVGRLADGTWKLAVTAPPVEGRANEAVLEWLGEHLGVKRRALTIVRGETSRAKQVDVQDLDEVEVERRLRAALAQHGKDGRSVDGE